MVTGDSVRQRLRKQTGGGGDSYSHARQRWEVESLELLHQVSPVTAGRSCAGKPPVGVNRQSIQSRCHIHGIGIEHQLINHLSDNTKGGNAHQSSARKRDEFDSLKQALEL